MINLTIVDDHKMILQGLSAMLKSVPEITSIKTFFESKALFEFLKENTTDVLLLDINMPDKNGLEISKIISNLYPSIKIIALTNYSETNFIKSMMRNGAKGYMLKNSSRDELVEGIKTVMKNEVYLPKQLQEQLLNDNFGVKASKFFIPKLTRREKEVLIAISQEYTNKEIADNLFLSIKTIETHRNNLLQKFSVKNTAGLIKEAYLKGFIN